MTATLANGQVFYLDPSTKIASVPHWPGAVVWGAKIPCQHGVTLTAYWPGNAAAPLKFSEHVGDRRRHRMDGRDRALVDGGADLAGCPASNTWGRWEMGDFALRLHPRHAHAPQDALAHSSGA